MYVQHAGLSAFVDASSKALWRFTHAVFDDTSLQFISGTAGCTTTNRTSCPQPQCASSFNLSPYGLWKLEISPEWFATGVEIDALVFQLYVQYDGGNRPPGPHGFVMFDGPDHVEPGSTC